MDLENSVQQSFATLSKLLTFRYIRVTSGGRGYSRKFALSKDIVSAVYGTSQSLKAVIP